MKMYVITDSPDTITGMRLSGVEGTLVKDAQAAEEALIEVMQKKDYGIVLMTAPVIELIRDLVYNYKLNQKTPLIIEIPDRHGNGSVENSITKYVEEAIGLKLQ